MQSEEDIADQLLGDTPSQSGGCELSLTKDTRTNIYLFVYGYIQGLYDSDNYPTGGCVRCETVALPMS